MEGRTIFLFSLLIAAYSSSIAAQNTECKNASMADIVFLVDSSSSIDARSFQEVRTFLRSVVQALDVGPNKVRIGLAQYSDEPHKEFLLKDHRNQPSLLSAVEKILPRGGRTNTGKAMQFLLSDYFTQEAGSRVGQRVPQVVVVLTDGESTDKVEEPARELRKQGVIVFGIGVGAANKTQLEIIANKPPKRFTFSIDSYEALQGLTDGLLQIICDSVLSEVQALEERFADVFYLVDSSISQGEFNIFKSELTKLITRNNFGLSAHRVGLAQYGRDTRVEFFLNAFQTKQQILSAVRGFRLRPTPNQPSNLGKAMQNAKDLFFNIEQGGRGHQSARQSLVVVTGRESDDPVSQISEELMEAGITIVGMNAGGVLGNIQDFASPGYIYLTPRVLQIRDAILTVKEDVVTEDCKGANKADIAFIVDESGSIGIPNFRLVRAFLHSIVSSLDVSPTRVKVGIVTYNETATDWAPFNMFDNKPELLKFIDLLPYRGGKTKTGAALNFTRETIFTAESGSRKEKGVQQVAVVITDGKSHDNVSEAAITLRRAGVTIYSVGIKNASETELIQMASHPPDRHVFNVLNFTDLKPLKQNLQKFLCENIIDQAVTTADKDSKEACLQKDEADIFFLMDDSGSIGNLDFKDMQNFIIKILNTFNIGPEHVRVGLVKYAAAPVIVFDLDAYSDTKSLEKAVNGISHDGGGTETGKALKSMVQHFEKANTTRGHKVPEYLIVITDGESDDDVKAPAEVLKKQGVIIYAIGIKNSMLEELEAMASDPKKVVQVDNFDALNSINNDITTDICSEDTCKDVQGDIIFLVDGSWSISTDDFKKMKEFMKSIISKSAIEKDKVHVGLMQFSTNYKLEFPLNKFHSAADMSKAIDNMQQLDRGTLTGKAIREVSQYFDAYEGGRPGLSQNLIVITDGEAQDEVKGPAEALRKKGVVIYAIGVGSAKTSQLVEISGSSDRAYTGKNFDALQDLESRMLVKLCKKECLLNKADIIFLVDSSKSINTEEYDSMRLFIESVVNQTTVGKDQTRFGLISYSDEPKLYFTLNEFDTRRKVLAAIPKSKPPQGDTYTDKALTFALPYFNAEHGGRKQVTQMLVVITDGEATNPYNLQDPSDALRKSGVDVLSVGVKKANREELLTIAGGDESKVFMVSDFKALEKLYTNISSAFCETSKPVCEGDVVFLLDRSSSINLDDYKVMKDFTADLVGSFNISEKFVHVGLAQFSDSPHDEFYLNQFYEKDDVIRQINGLVHTGVDTYIGKALNHMQEYFLESRGSRTGLPKKLVLITDGDSHDDVEDAADTLRNKKIDLYAIGVGDVHDLELLQITGTPERLFTVNNFNALTTIKTDFMKTLCDEPVVPPPPPPPFRDCEIDIAMGFDISRRTGARGELLVSGHTKLQVFLPQIAQYVSEVQGLCCTGPVKTKIAYLVPARDGSFLFDTNFEAYNEGTVDKVLSLQISQPSYFNTAVLNAFKQMFMVKSKAFVKVLVMFSDGLDEDVMKLEYESDLLRKSGVSSLLMVALEGARNPTQLQMVEFGRGFGYMLPLTIGMPSIGSTILKQIDSVSDKECCGVPCKCSGHEGVPGSRGPPGSKGSSGQKGQPGFPGEEGVPGARGPPGPSGPQGLQGCPGSRGQKGYRGTSGNTGDGGEDGLDGVNGEQGETGLDGARGERGDPGNPGIPGIGGEAGLQGERGLRGDPGESGFDNTVPGAKGDPGNPGLVGVPGPDGGPGGSGDEGQPGRDGRRGPPGQKGAPGRPGDPGLPGSRGASGLQGRRGANGERGPKGVNGFPGPQGAAGPAGDDGLAGRRGPNGQKGQPGEPGVKGAPGSVGPRGMPGQDGSDGYGAAGPLGAKGDPGFPGYPGLTGEDGLKGTKGYPGVKGNRGRGGNSGGPGRPGVPGEPGPPGRKGPKGPPGDRGRECQLITKIRENCACYQGESECPAFPTELVFGLDMSDGVTPAAFQRQRAALLSLLEDITVSESNCPTGARVAVVGYSSDTKYLIRFQDYRRKSQLIEAVKNIALERTAKRRQLGAAMRFVGQHVLKRVRSGLLMRKVAVFFSSGPTQDSDDIVSAVMEYRARGVASAVVAPRNIPAERQAMEVDDTGNSLYVVLGRDVAADLQELRSCIICFDPCRRPGMCPSIQDPLPPQEADLDLVMVLDSSREVKADEYAGMQELLGSVVEQLAVSPQPRRAGNQARVAAVQQSGTRAVKVEFGLGSYQNHNQMKRHLIRNMTQLGGSSALGRTLDYTLKEVLLKAGQPRRRRAVLAVVGTQTAYEDRAKLRYVSQKAKCEGVALFVVTVGDRYSRAQVEELASPPLLQHLVHLDRLKAEQQGYARRFFRVFLSALGKGINSYPPPAVKRTCGDLADPDEADGQGSAAFLDFAADSFAEQRGEQLDATHTVLMGEEQSFLSGADDQNKQTQTQTQPQPQTQTQMQTQTQTQTQTQPQPQTQTQTQTQPQPQMQKQTQTQTQTQMPSLKSVCLLAMDVGSCRNYAIRWSFDRLQGRCSPFWYGGCGGNRNRFDTKAECEKVCPTDRRQAAAAAARGRGGVAGLRRRTAGLH